MSEETINKQKLSKDEICNLIFANKTFKSLLNIYNDGKRNANAYTIQSDREWTNGLLNKFVVVEINNKIDQIIIPIFSTEKTITWSLNYIKAITRTLEANNKSVDENISSLIKCCLFFMDKDTNDITFLSVIELNDWIDNGNKGRNGTSVYFWNDKLPNQWGLNKSKIENQNLIASLPFMTKKELQAFCMDQAMKLHKQFNISEKRSEAAVIKHTAKGTYAEVWLYLQLLKAGHDVQLVWENKDDRGIDIIYTLNGKSVNIDVKSTADEYLKIRRLRKETHYYAVIQWNKTVPALTGFLDKHQFWPSKYGTDTKPEQIGELFRRKLTKKWIKESFLNLDELHSHADALKKKQLKRKEQLFEI